MSYPDSVRYLYSLGNELKAGAKFGLERMQSLLRALGDPQKDQRFIHIAGTNGKGSTAAMIASILCQAGLRTGLYTSPHLIEPTERIQIDGEEISAEAFAAAFNTVHSAAESLVRTGEIDAHPSYFETVTAMALLVFRDRTQISVIEVGLGGRLDATNVIAPELCVITPVSFDHEAFLGNTLESIAGEKAGILKGGVPVVMMPQENAAEGVIARRAEELGCRIIRTAELDVQNVSVNANASSFDISGLHYQCSLPGRHQIENAKAAILSARELGVTQRAIAAGLRQVRWPGRLELVSQDPDTFLDGAHNPAGAKVLAQYLREFFAGRPIWLVYGAMRDKAVEEVTEELFPLATKLILTVPDMARALRPEALLQMTDRADVTVIGSVREAIEETRLAPRDAAIFFTGSLYLVGEARKLLIHR